MPDAKHNRCRDASPRPTPATCSTSSTDTPRAGRSPNRPSPHPIRRRAPATVASAVELARRLRRRRSRPPSWPARSPRRCGSGRDPDLRVHVLRSTPIVGCDSLLRSDANFLGILRRGSGRDAGSLLRPALSLPGQAAQIRRCLDAPRGHRDPRPPLQDFRRNLLQEGASHQLQRLERVGGNQLARIEEQRGQGRLQLGVGFRDLFSDRRCPRLAFPGAA